MGGRVTEKGSSGVVRSASRKRIFDLAVGIPLVLLILPTVAILAVAVAISLRAWPFFVHERVGRDGRPFRFLKLRTLPPSAPRYASKYEIRNVKRSRLTSWMRSRHLDELPQLLLVVVGKMSLVGPRPEMSELHGAMSPAFARARTQVRPGCSGLWQISDGSMALIHEAPAYDLFYLRRWSLRMDLWILARTAFHAVGLADTITLSDVPVWASGQGLLTPDRLDDVERQLADVDVTIDLTSLQPVAELPLRVSPAGS